MKIYSLKKIAPGLTKQKRRGRKLSHIHLEDFNLNDFLYHRETRS
jgi:hypothetical protein